MHMRARRPIASFVVPVTMLLTSAVGLVAAVGTANAADPATTIASANPYDFTPRVLDGRVLAVQRVGDVVVVGGSFTQIQAAGNNKPILNVPYLFAFDANTGDILTNFAATPNDQVRTIVPTAAGDAVYIGGGFGKVNNVGGRVALVRLSDGSRMPFRAPPMNNEVYEMRLVGNKLLVGGAFATVNNQPHVGLTALDATTGALASYSTPNFGGTAWGLGSTTVRKLDVTPDGSKLIAIGNFDNVDGTTRNQIAMIDLGPTGATLNGWSTDRYPGRNTAGTNLCAKAFDSYMRDVDFSPDGSFFVVVTTGAYRSGTLCDSSARWETNRSTGALQPTWVDYSGGDTSWGVEVAGSIVYVGGHFRWWNNPFRGDAAGPGAVAREGIAALDARNGLPFSWNPTRDRGVGLFDFDVTSTEVWAGSDTDTWAGEYRPRVAGFPLAGGTDLPADRVADLPADVVLLDSTTSGVDQTERFFDGVSVNGTSAQTPAEDWSQARGAVMIDGTVYTGWADGTFKARTFDGTSFGAARNLDLYPNGQATDSRFFGVDVPRITGMFFDRANGRLYYTLKSSNCGSTGQPRACTNGGLYYRYFTPESGVVGAQRFTALNGSLIGASTTSFTQPQGMFLVNGLLYFVDSAGVLKSIPFSPGTDGAAGGPIGTATTVDASRSWTAAGLFASTAHTAVGPNTLPNAAISARCINQTCSFDASSSNDPDGSITSYSFDFGDGTSTGAVSQATAQHVYGVAGQYTATVTVTDNRGGTATAGVTVNPAPISSSIAFRSSAQYASAGSQSKHTITIPGDVQVGDQLVAVVTGSTSGTVADPAGWTRLDEQLDSDVRSVVFTRTAGAADAGASLAFQWSGACKSTIVVAAYSGVSGATASGRIETSTSAVAGHATPSTSVPVDGAWVLSFWADKNTSTTSWTPPAGQVVRGSPAVAAAAGTARVTALLGDDGLPTASGSRSGLTAVADAAATKATMFTIILSPS